MKTAKDINCTALHCNVITIKEVYKLNINHHFHRKARSLIHNFLNL